MATSFDSSRYSVGANAPVVAHASAEARAAFISSTYLHLLGAIVAFGALEVFWFSTPVAQAMLSFLVGAKFAMLIFIAAFVGMSYFANQWAMSTTSKGMQYAGLGLYTVLQSLMFVPLIYMALLYGAQGRTDILPRGIAITLTLFGCLTGVVFVTRKDFSFMRSVLMFGGLAAIGLVVASLLFGFELGLFFSYAMVALACGYILYDTSNVMLHYRTNQQVAAALALFASVTLLFYYVLRVLMARRS